VVIEDNLLLSIMGEDNFTRMDDEHSLNPLSGCPPESFALGSAFSQRNYIQLSPSGHPSRRSTPLVVRHNDFNLFSVGFEVLAAVVIRISIFWDIMACSRSHSMKLFLICNAPS
jgi:hypothetical protein